MDQFKEFTHDIYIDAVYGCCFYCNNHSIYLYYVVVFIGGSKFCYYCTGFGLPL